MIKQNEVRAALAHAVRFSFMVPASDCDADADAPCALARAALASLEVDVAVCAFDPRAKVVERRYQVVHRLSRGIEADHPAVLERFIAYHVNQCGERFPVAVIDQRGFVR